MSIKWVTRTTTIRYSQMFEINVFKRETAPPPPHSNRAQIHTNTRRVVNQLAVIILALVFTQHHCVCVCDVHVVNSSSLYITTYIVLHSVSFKGYNVKFCTLKNILLYRVELTFFKLFLYVKKDNNSRMQKLLHKINVCLLLINKFDPFHHIYYK